jgi:telomerase protein component 1
LFLGILGERYGWIPTKQNFPTGADFQWMHDYWPGASVTELEIYQAALAKPNEALGKAFFYFRDPSFMRLLCLCI